MAELPQPLLHGSSEDPPPVVVEAESLLHRTRRRWGTLLGTLTAAMPAIILAAHLGLLPHPLDYAVWEMLFPPSLWLLGALLTGAAIWYPPGRNGRWARRVLRRWEDLRLDQVIPAGVEQRDARQRAAEALCQRICAHPSVDPRATAVVHRLREQVQRGVHDLHTAELLLESGQREEGERAQSAAEVQIARALTRLDEVSRAVLASEEIETREIQAQLREVLAHLSAEQEVEQLLAPEVGSNPLPPA